MSKLVPKLRFKEFSGEWDKKILNQICKINPTTNGLPNSFIYIDLESVVNGTLLKETKIDKDEAPSRAQRLLKKGDVIYQMVRPYQKNNLFFNFDNNDYVASTGYAQLRALDSSGFLYQLIHTDTFVNKVLNKSTGSNYPAINSKDLSQINVIIPTLKEQQKIANTLSSLDSLIEAYQRKVEALQKHKKGLMQQLFPAEGANVPKLRFKEFSGEWEEKKLGEVSNVSMGQSPTSSSYNNLGNGVYLIQGNADIKNRFSNPRQWTTEPTKLCDIGDLILTVRAPVGYIAKSIHKACIGRGVCSLSKKENNNIEFIYQFLLSYEKNWVSLEQGSTFTAVSGNDIKSLKIFIPTPKEQQKIANTLSSLDNLIEAQQRKVEALKKHKKGLMQQMFVSGEE